MQPSSQAYGLAIVKSNFCSDLPNGWASLKSKVRALPAARGQAYLSSTANLFTILLPPCKLHQLAKKRKLPIYSIIVPRVTGGPISLIGVVPFLPQGKEYSACSTGYRRTVGFVLPVGKMFKDDIIKDRVIPEDRNINEDAYNMAQFFGSVCSPRQVWQITINSAAAAAAAAAYDDPIILLQMKAQRRATANGPKRDGSVWEPLCSLCAKASNATNATPFGTGRFNGPPEEHKCSESEDPNDEAYNPYAGYTGASQKDSDTARHGMCTRGLELGDHPPLKGRCNNLFPNFAGPINTWMWDS
eukprot:1161162-Pelagomonas_calceolata.AAC.8